MGGRRRATGPAAPDAALVPTADAPSGTAARGPLAVLLYAVVVSGLVPALLVMLTADGPGDAHAGLILAMVLAGLRFAWILGSPVRHLHELVVWVFVYVFLGMAPYVQLRLGVEPETASNIQPAYVPTATLIVLVGSLALIAGSWAARNHTVDAASAPALQPRRAAVLALVALALSLYYIRELGLRNLFLAVVETSRRRAEIWPDPAIATFIFGAVSMSLLVAGIALVRVRREMPGSAPVHARVLQWATLAMLLLIANPVSSPRYIFGSIILAVLAAFGLYATVGRFRAVAAATLVGMIVVFPVADTSRYETTTSVSLENPLLSLTTSDFDAFAQIVNTVQYVDLEGSTAGRQMLGTLLFWMPRSIWPDKPLDTGVMIAEYKEYGFTNLSSPLWGEFFIDFGWVGLILGMVLVGYWARRFDITTEAQLRERSAPALIFCILPFYSLIILRGSLLQSLAYISVAVLFTLFVQRRST